MVSLEQVRLLESKVTKTIDYVRKMTEENSVLKGKLDSYQKRIDDLEVLIQGFKDDQSRIEDGILSALERLNQFEDALESKLSMESKHSTEAKPSTEAKHSAQKKPPAKPEKIEAPAVGEPAEEEKDLDSGELDIF